MYYFVIIILLLSGSFWWMAATLYRRLREKQNEIRNLTTARVEMGNFLGRITSTMQSSSGLDGLMHAGAKHFADQVGAESAAIYEADRSGLRALGVYGLYPLVHSGNRLVLNKHELLFETLRRERIESGVGFLGEVVALKRPELVPCAATDPRFAEFPGSDRLGSVMAVPIFRENDSTRLLGIICVVNNRNGVKAPFSEEQFDRLLQIVPHAVVALDLLRAYGQVSRQERLDQELDFARRVQHSLLPQAFPAWNQFSIDARTRSLKEVNGDYYDFVRIDDDRLLVVIGDACGKGIPACMMAAMARSMVRALAESFTNLSEFLFQVNAKMQRNTAEDGFVTLGCCLLDRKNNLIEFGRAGHTELLTYVRNHVRSIEPYGLALGALPPDRATFDTICMAFEPGMRFLLYSDGLTEATNENEEEFGIERLQKVFKKAGDLHETQEQTIQRIFDAVIEFSPAATDDRTVILIGHRDENSGDDLAPAEDDLAPAETDTPAAR